MKIIKAKISDIKGIQKCNKLLYVDKKLFDFSDIDYITDNIDNFYIIKQNNKIIAAMNFKNNNYIETLAVLSKGNGIGKKLVKYAINKAKKSGSSNISLDSLIKYSVQNFYINCGFKLENKLRTCVGYQYFHFYMNF